MVQPWKHHRTRTEYETHVPRLSHAHFPRCPRAKQHMTAGRRADLVVHVLCTLLFLCLSASLHLWSDTVELTPRSPPLDSEADSCITESGLCGWIMTADAESSTAVCAGLEWAERVTPGWRHCGQLILSLVKKPACSCCSEWKMRVFANWTYCMHEEFDLVNCCCCKIV